jgi:membrane protein implicated in regulation of membrane protease activity
MNGISSVFFDLGAWNWLILAALFFALELAAPGIFFVWFGIAAAVVGGVALVFDLSWQWQLVMFGILSVIAVIAARKLLRADDDAAERPLLNRRAQQHVGKSFVVAEAIANGHGKIRIGDSLWRVEGPDTAEGARVKVTSADGATLIVIPETG